MNDSIKDPIAEDSNALRVSIPTDSGTRFDTEFWLTQESYIAAGEPRRRSRHKSIVELSADASSWRFSIDCLGTTATDAPPLKPVGDPDLWNTEYVQVQMPIGDEHGCLHLTVTRSGQAISERHDKLRDPIAGWRGTAREIPGGWHVDITVPRDQAPAPLQFRLARWTPGEGITSWPTPFGSWWHVDRRDFLTVTNDLPSTDDFEATVTGFIEWREGSLFEATGTPDRSDKTEVGSFDAAHTYLAHPPEKDGDFLAELRGRASREPWLGFEAELSADIGKCQSLMKNNVYYGDQFIDLGTPPDWDSDHSDYFSMVHATRFDFLANLVGAYRQTGEEAYSQKAISLIESWISGYDFRQFLTPRRYTMRAGAAIVVSHRLVCMVRTAFSLIGTPCVSEPLLFDLYRIVREAAHALNTIIPRIYNKNHAIIIGDHMVQLSALCGELKAADSIREEYWEHLRRALDRQFLPDDIQIELSTSYHMICYIRLTEATSLCERAGVAVPEDITRWRRRILGGAGKYLFPNGQIAAFNDGSMGGFIDAIGCPDSSFQNTILREGDRLGVEEAIAIASNGRHGKMEAPFSHALPYAGHYMIRDGLKFEDMALAFDAGPFGIAHQHEDALSLMMVRYGKPLLIDIGSGAYDPALPMRQYSTSTESHSTICIDGQPQAARLFPDTWKRSTPWQGHHRFGKKLQFAHGEYVLGYGRDAKIQVRHERAVLFVNEEYVLLIDYLLGDGTHLVESRFALAPMPCSLLADGLITTSGSGDLCARLLHPSTAKVEVARGQEQPFAGWKPSTGHGVLPHPRLTFRWHAQLPCRTVTLLAPFQRETEIPHVQIAEADEYLTVELTRNGMTSTLRCGNRPVEIDFEHPLATLRVRNESDGGLRIEEM